MVSLDDQAAEVWKDCVLSMKYIIILIAAAMGFGAAWKYQGYKYGEQIATMQKDAAEATTKAVKEAMEKTQADQKRKDDALKEANLRSQKNALAAAAANRTADSLRDQLATARAGLPQATCEAARNYAATLSDVFGSCTARLAELAKQADGHASDVRTMIEAWPEP